MPTILEYVGYDKPFLAFGQSLISTPAEETFAVNYTNETYQFYQGDYVLHFDGGDGDRSIALYNFRNDLLMRNNILGQNNVQEGMERKLKAIIQQYMNRMIHDRLTPETDKNKR